MLLYPLFALSLPAAAMPEAAGALPAFAPVGSTEPAAAVADEGDDGEEDGTDEGDDSAPKKKKKSASHSDDDARIREIVRGFYAKANVGAATYVGITPGFNQAVSSGTLVGISLGQDFVDTEKQSMAWEVTLNQGIHNGGPASYTEGIGCAAGPAVCTEGDLRTYSLQASYEFSAYPARRFGIGFRAGAGALWSPLLMESNTYATDVLPTIGYEPNLHNAIHPFGFAGPSFEYYTKLSHFSVGGDVDAFYAVGWDLGINASVALKYTL